jgi:glycosyltransferase involved in cell wall biosynthesis
MSEIKVIRILNRMVIGGPSYNVSYLTKYMAPDYATLLLAGAKESDEIDSDELEKELGIKPIYIKNLKKSLLKPFDDIKAYFAIRKIILEYKPTIVHTHAAKSGFIGRLVAIHCKVPIVLHTFHGHYLHSYFHPILTKTLLAIDKYLAKKSTGIIVISESQRKDLVDEAKVVSPEKAFLIPNGIDLSKFKTNKQEKRKQWRAQYNISEKALVIGIVGRLVTIKNHRMFIQCIQKVLSNHNGTNIHFAIIGDGDLRLELQHQLNELNISFNYFPENKNLEQVIFTSWQKEMDVVYAGLDIVCLTSNNEGTPITLIEAQASAKPIVSTNVGGVMDTVIKNKTAFLTESNNVDEFSNYLLQLITDGKLRVEMGEHGQQFVERMYSHNRLVDDMKSLYQTLLNEYNKKRIN